MSRGLHTNFIFSGKEMRFVDVVVNTENRIIVSQLMNKIRYMIKSILKQVQRYEDHAILN